MRGTEALFRRLTDRLELEGEAMPGQTVLELQGDGRILVEQHGGILQYSQEQITVKTTFGGISVTGENLKLTHMSKQVLILSGRIQSLSLERREKI